MSDVGALKHLSQRIAVVFGTPDPFSTVLCLKLLQRGTRLVLMERQDAYSVASDLNILWGGLDVNYASPLHTDPWGAKPVAISISARDWSVSGVVDHCQTVFGKGPDFIVDMNETIEEENIKGFCKALTPALPLWIESTETDSHDGRRLEEGQDENIDPQSRVSIYTFCDPTVIQSLTDGAISIQSLYPLTNKIVQCTTTDIISTLSNIFHSRCTVTPRDVRAVSISVMKPEQKSTTVVSSTKQTEIEPDQTDQIFPSDSCSLSPYTTFDAILQKCKDYPIDWCQGGTASDTTMADISYKVMTRAVVNYTVRWLLLGYFVIGFAVPKALGWDGV